MIKWYLLQTEGLCTSEASKGAKINAFCLISTGSILRIGDYGRVAEFYLVYTAFLHGELRAYVILV